MPRCSRHSLGCVAACALVSLRRMRFLRFVAAGPFFTFFSRYVRHTFFVSLPRVCLPLRCRRCFLCLVVLAAKEKPNASTTIVITTVITTVIIITVRSNFRLKQSTSIKVDNPTWPFDLATMPLFTHRLAGYCPRCHHYFRFIHVYYNLERGFLIIIYEHEDRRICATTSIEADVGIQLQI